MTKKRAPIANLNGCWLSAVASPDDLSQRVLSTNFTKFEVVEIRALAKDKGNYLLSTQKKANGKPRAIQEPKPRLQQLCKRVHLLLARVAPPDYLHSVVRGRSYITNPVAHDASTKMFKIDIEKFFPSITRAAINNFFRDILKCRGDVAGLLADLLTYEGRLPTGSSASPILAYYSHRAMFDEIFEFAKSRGLKMTCYVDDMTFSGDRADSGAQFAIRQIISRHGLRSHKARNFAKAQPRVVTGVCITLKGPRVPNTLHLKIAGGFTAFEGATSAADKAKMLRALVGMLYAAGQIEAKFKARAISLQNENRKILEFPMPKRARGYLQPIVSACYREPQLGLGEVQSG